MSNLQSTSEATERQIREDTIAFGILTLLVFTAAQRILGFGRGLLFCRWLDPATLGEWDLARGFLIFATPIVVLSIPSAFGRYLEHYRRRSQTSAFLWRVGGFTLFTTGMGCSLLWIFRREMSEFVFGSAGHETTIAWTSLALAGTVGSSFAAQAFTAMRYQRASSSLSFLQSLFFALISVVLMLRWEPSIDAVLIAFAAAGLLTSVFFLVLLVRHVRSFGESSETRLDGVWRRVLPFALTVWFTDWVTNLFAIVDRYMIVHFSGLPSDDALQLVGQYHTARLIPIVFVQVASLLASLLMPYLVRQFDSGDRLAAGRQLNGILKGAGLVLMGGSTVVLVAAPWIFDYLLQSKYPVGALVLPGVLTFCCWGSLAFTARTYLWCAEKSRWVVICFLIGLLVNLSLNALLLPAFGLLGAVWATAAANGVALLGLFVLGANAGWRLDRGTILISLAPFALLFGVYAGAAAFLTLLIAIPILFNQQEKSQVRSLFEGASHAFLPRLSGETS